MILNLFGWGLGIEWNSSIVVWTCMNCIVLCECQFHILIKESTHPLLKIYLFIIYTVVPMFVKHQIFRIPMLMNFSKILSNL